MPRATLSDGFEMNYEIFEGLVDQPTLCIHGNLASNRWWHPLISQFEENPQGNQSIILAEWRGCGNSSGPTDETQLHPKEIALDYIELIKLLSIEEPVDLVGHSAGGLISLNIMLQNPDKVRNAFLISPVSAKGLFVSDDKWDIFDEMSRSKELLGQVLQAAARPPDSSSRFFSSLVEDAFGLDPVNWHGVLRQFSKADISNEISKIQNKVTIVHGQEDLVLPIEESEKMANLLPNSEFMPLKGIGHSAGVECPQKIFQKLISV